MDDTLAKPLVATPTEGAGNTTLPRMRLWPRPQDYPSMFGEVFTVTSGDDEDD